MLDEAPRWVGVPVVKLPAEEQRDGLPQYRTPRGGTATIAGPAADGWIYPRHFQSEGGALFVERPMPNETLWGITFHTRYKRTAVGEVLAQYVEGRSSGFPFWPSLHYAVRVAARSWQSRW